MPELPDIQAYLHALEPRIIGRTLEKLRLGSPFVLRTVEPRCTDANGRAVRELRRIGKRVALGSIRGERRGCGGGRRAPIPRRTLPRRGASRQ